MTDSDETRIAREEPLDRRYPDLPPGLTPRHHGPALLTGWTRRGFDVAPTRSVPPAFLALLTNSASGTDRPSPPPHVYRDSSVYAHLGTDPLLWLWIRLIASDADVARRYGTTTELFDRAYFYLEGVAFRFLNDMLARLPAFDEQRVLGDAVALFEGIAAGEETYEIGAALPSTPIASAEEAIALGPNVELRKIEGAWARERFEQPEKIPSHAWALVATVTRQREPRSPFQDEPENDGRDGRSLDRALLPVRLALPGRLHWLANPYRIGLRGDRSPVRRASYWRDDWTMIRKVFGRRLTAKQVAELRQIGQLLGAPARAPGYFGSADDERDPLDLALRTFASAALRQEWQDEIVDLTVALEALLARDKEEIAFKVRLRAALLLGRGRSASQVFDTANGLYSLRSSLVHGGSAKDRSSAIRKICDSWPVDGTRESSPSLATAIASALAGELLRAFVYLEDAGLNPIDKAKRFLDQLDRLAFDHAERRRIQKAARIRTLPRRLAGRPRRSR